MLTLRATPAQRAGRGGWCGTVAGALVALGAAGIGATLTLGSREWTLAALAVVCAPVAAGPVVGTICGLVVRSRARVDLDNVGIRLMPPQPVAFVPWRRVADVRTERHAGRTYVTVSLDDGKVVLLAAPYDGRLLARDRHFERKLFMLRGLWGMHRNYTADHRQRPDRTTR